MWPNPQFPADLVTFTDEILNGKLHFLCSVFLRILSVLGVFRDPGCTSVLCIFSNNQLQVSLFRHFLINKFPWRDKTSEFMTSVFNFFEWSKCGTKQDFVQSYTRSGVIRGTIQLYQNFDNRSKMFISFGTRKNNFRGTFFICGTCSICVAKMLKHMSESHVMCLKLYILGSTTWTC